MLACTPPMTLIVLIGPVNVIGNAPTRKRTPAMTLIVLIGPVNVIAGVQRRWNTTPALVPAQLTPSALYNRFGTI